MKNTRQNKAMKSRKADKLRDKIINELRDQGFEVNGQIEFDFGGIYFKGKFFSHEDLDTRNWGYSRRIHEKH